VADVVGVDIEAVNFASEYKDRVFADFLREYQAGRTPNPDVLCNAEIKFKAFLDHAMTLGADLIATGHYARVRRTCGQFELLKAVDHTKDQSYFLHRLNQAQLSKTLFPLGEIPKTEVRQIAEKLKLPNAAKKDSTGICFIGERPFREFLNRYLSYKPGPMKTPTASGGRARGPEFYTLGQRKGIGIGGVKAYKNADGSSDAWYVARKDVANNTLYIVQGHDHPWLLSSSLRPTRPAGSRAWRRKRRAVGQDPLPPGRRGVRNRAGRRRLRLEIHGCPVGRHAGPVGRAVRRRRLPRRRHHRQRHRPERRSGAPCAAAARACCLRTMAMTVLRTVLSTVSALNGLTMKPLTPIACADWMVAASIRWTP
jgi:hypothetical protein